MKKELANSVCILKPSKRVSRTPVTHPYINSDPLLERAESVDPRTNTCISVIKAACNTARSST